MADTQSAMAIPSLPAAFGHLLDERNTAADAALVEVLPHLEPFAQAAALDILVKHAHPPSLAGVVGGLSRYEDQLRHLIFARASELSAGIRVAIMSPSFENRARAIETIVRGDAGRSAYLLADALRSPCVRTRELAAAGLSRMTERLLERQATRTSSTEIGELDAQAEGLSEALRMAVQRWEIHLKPQVLKAALWLGDKVESTILKKLQEPRTKLAQGVTELLAGTSDPRLAGFVVRALAIPALAPAAARAIDHSRDGAFICAVLEESWLLADPRIQQGCRRIRDGQWLRIAAQILHTLDVSAVGGAVRLLGTIGGSPERRIELFRELAGAGNPAIRRAVLWQLVHDKSQAATDLLTVIAARSGDTVALIAGREVRSRRWGLGHPVLSTALLGHPAHSAANREAFDCYWSDFDAASGDHVPAVRDAVARLPGFDALLRAKLASSEPLDRARALRIALELGMLREFTEPVHRLAHDPDPVVRGLAVGALWQLPGATTERLLRAAINDPDDRVVANAVEGLDRLDVADRVAWTEPKLKSPSSRVRANAVKSLLRAELRQAGEVLLDMLEDPSAAHRLSALWVVERLRSRAALGRVRGMSLADPDQRIKERANRVCSLVAHGLTPGTRSLGTASPVCQFFSKGGATR